MTRTVGLLFIRVYMVRVCVVLGCVRDVVGKRGFSDDGSSLAIFLVPVPVTTVNGGQQLAATTSDVVHGPMRRCMVDLVYRKSDLPKAFTHTQGWLSMVSQTALNYTRVAWVSRLSHQGSSPEGWEKLPLAVRVVLALLLLALGDHVLPAQFIGRKVLRAFLAVGLVELEALERRDAELLARVRRLFHRAVAGRVPCWREGTGGRCGEKVV